MPESFVAIEDCCVLQCSLDVDPESLTKRVGRLRQPALLESARGFGDAGRWSILAARPRWVFEAAGDRWSRAWSRPARNSPATETGVDPLSALARLLDEYGLARSSESCDPTSPPFQGGLIGFIGYDTATLIEFVARRHACLGAFPDIRLGLYDTFVTVDRDSDTVKLWAVDLLGEGRQEAEQRLDEMRAAIERPLGVISRFRVRDEPISTFSRGEYVAAVRRALEYIAAGDVYQVNLSQRFLARFDGAPLDLYARLKRISPAPFAAFLEWTGFAVVCASPELFYQTSGPRIVTRPIKGTRPRSADAVTDANLVGELRQSQKDRAELTMIIDLERNDLGRACEHGSVRVVEPYAVESYAQVHHLVATVEGRLREEADPVDVLRALFPGGSITGAPKIRAMEIIDEFEKNRRGLYTGAIGYFSRGGLSAFNIAIRTITVESDSASYQVGGGIVADSDPQAEYEETLHKGRGMMEVLSDHRWPFRELEP